MNATTTLTQGGRLTDDVAMMGESIQQCGGELGITKHISPFREAQVGRDNNAGAFIELADQMEE